MFEHVKFSWSFYSNKLKKDINQGVLKYMDETSDKCLITLGFPKPNFLPLFSDGIWSYSSPSGEWELRLYLYLQKAWPKCHRGSKGRLLRKLTTTKNNVIPDLENSSSPQPQKWYLVNLWHESSFFLGTGVHSPCPISSLTPQLVAGCLWLFITCWKGRAGLFLIYSWMDSAWKRLQPTRRIFHCDA